MLSNGEIYTAYIEAANQTLRPQDERIALAFARAIEAAVLAKLQAQSDPVAWLIEYEYLAGRMNRNGSIEKFDWDWIPNSFLSETKDAEIDVKHWRNKKVIPLYTAQVQVQVQSEPDGNWRGWESGLELKQAPVQAHTDHPERHYDRTCAACNAPVHQDVNQQLLEALKELLDCPYEIDPATVSKAGLDATMREAPYQVVGNMSVALIRVRKARAAIAAVEGK